MSFPSPFTQQVAFPEPLLVHPDVLVEEYIHGEPISRYEDCYWTIPWTYRTQVSVNPTIHTYPIPPFRISYIHMEDKDTPIRRHLAETSLTAFLTMLIHHNYTHGTDIHARRRSHANANRAFDLPTHPYLSTQTTTPQPTSTRATCWCSRPRRSPRAGPS